MTEPTPLPPEADFCGLIVPVEDDPSSSTEDDGDSTEDDR